MKNKKEILEKFRIKWGYKIDSSIRKGYIEVIENIDRDNLIEICSNFINKKKTGERDYFPKPIDFEKADEDLINKKNMNSRQLDADKSGQCKACNDIGLIPILCKKERDSGKAEIYISYGGICSCSKGQLILKSQNINASRKEYLQTHYIIYADKFNNDFQFNWDKEKYDNYPEFIFDKYDDLRIEQIKLNKNIDKENQKINVGF